MESIANGSDQNGKFITQDEAARTHEFGDLQHTLPLSVQLHVRERTNRNDRKEGAKLGGKPFRL